MGLAGPGLTVGEAGRVGGRGGRASVRVMVGRGLSLEEKDATDDSLVLMVEARAKVALQPPLYPRTSFEPNTTSRPHALGAVDPVQGLCDHGHRR